MTPMERAARALALSYICTRDNRAPDDPYAVEYAMSSWRQHEHQVHAVLTAIRDPSEGMADAGSKAAAYHGEDGRPVWQAMIDAALAEGV